MADPFFANVVLLSGFAGADASTAVVDESTYNRTLTAQGNAQIDTAQSKFGGSSLLLDGTGDAVTSNAAAELSLGSGDFTIEGWFRFAAVGAVDQALMSKWITAGGDREWALIWQGSASPDVLTFVYSTTGASGLTAVTSSTFTPSTGQWYHIAADRNGTTWRLYVDGVMVGKTTGLSVTLYTGLAGLRIGNINSSGEVSYFNGHMDEVRITKGTSRYGATSGDTSFTPPVEAFPRSDIEQAARVTQSSLEQFFTTTADGWVTQVGLEMWSTTATVTGQAAVTQAALEMWARVEAVAAAGRAKIWNGSAWTLKPVKVWSGSAWAEKPLKVWNGSAWT